MTHLITPPPELLQLWFEQHDDYNKGIKELLIEAARYGADQELEACCHWLEAYDYDEVGRQLAEVMHAARRPKLPSLKEQALQALSEAVKMADDFPPEGICSGQADIIRRALEQLDD
jgi:hypothetical protein